MMCDVVSKFVAQDRCQTAFVLADGDQATEDKQLSPIFVTSAFTHTLSGTHHPPFSNKTVAQTIEN